ncbi:sulfotransferase [Shewanella abyssi]|uniref:sulfotransferase family protein n=1 Tax=Shewanella abyssi TaxID=311789 RepID=UPI00200D38E2|nr:sulfotransferase [Shewanella abyssi]MCL1049562.1 sulfotransferase [Shewanella abyssi]
MIFVVGNSRSGTTMLSRILGNNKKVHTFQEIHFLESIISPDDLNTVFSNERALHLLNKLFAIQKQSFFKQHQISQYSNESKLVLLKIASDKITPANVFSSFLDYYSGLYGKELACEQTPKNVYYLNEINLNISNTLFINMVRDPRSIMLSQKNKWKRKFLGLTDLPLYETLRSWSLYHPFTVSTIWKSSVEQCLSYNGDNLLSVKFEDLILNPKSTVINICDFLSLEYSDSMLAIPQVGSSIGADSKSLGVNPEKLSTWENSSLTDTEIYICEKLNGNLMGELGYELSNVKPNYFMLALFIFSFPFKISLSILLNLSRMKNIKATLIKRLGIK